MFAAGEDRGRREEAATAASSASGALGRILVTCHEEHLERQLALFALTYFNLHG